MKKLRRLSSIFKYAAIATLIVAVLAFIDLTTFPWLEDARGLLMYIVFMIPVLFASLAVSLRMIAKALEE